MQPRKSILNFTKDNFLEALCHSLQEGAAIIEKASGQLIFCNQAWKTMFQIDSLADMDIHSLNQLRKIRISESAVRDRLNILEEKGVFREQVEYVSTTGRAFWGEIVLRVLRSEEAVYYLVVIDKIDRLKESEEKLAQDKQRFNALLEHASLGIVEVNKRGEIININLSALRLFGYDKHELLNQKIEMLIPMRFHSTHKQHRDAYLDNPNNRPMGLGMDLFAVRKDGKEFPVEVSLTNYMIDNEQYVIAFVSDISVRKKNELEIKKLNDALEETVELRTKELKNAIQQLEISKEGLYKSLEKEKELSELKSRFVSMASHEFRTPLSTVLSSAYLLEQYNTGEESKNREKHLKRIISSVNMLTDILNDFLSVGKIEEGKIHVRLTEFDIRKLIGSAIDEIKVNLKKEQVIHYIHEGEFMARLDASLLKHIILNLLSNASKFSPENSVIEIKTSREEDRLTLWVKDHGIGISPEDQKHLMERFFRGTNTVNIQGTGLGLHIVSKYTELMNGEIKCTSALQKGTTFILSFNLKRTDHEEDPADRRQ